MQPDQYKNILEALGDGVYVVDRNRLITYWNAGAAAITGYEPAAVVGRFCFDNILEHVDGEGRSLCRNGCPLAATIADGQPREMEVYLRHRDGQRVAVKVRSMPLRDGSGRVNGAVEVFAENASALAARQYQVELERAALVDQLTLVANRRFAESALASQLAEVKRLGWSFGVLLADVDRFKEVNDVHGHPAGDRALRTIAATMAGAVRAYDLVARWGGEEFLVLCPGLEASGLLALAERLRMLVERSGLRLDDGRFLPMTISIGVAGASRGDTADTLLARADAALYRSKADGRNRVTLG
ncbi:MAG TPA: diguanylate cyclase [Vicinamibacterales bacterium]|nr:diguanylate cyclase [Vicinamibacterales bacterium]